MAKQLFVPVLISAYNRYNLLQKCIESLKGNPEASYTHLFLALDAPMERNHINACERVFEYANSITGFNEVTVIRREKNIGSTQNIKQAMDLIFSYYDRVVFIEDDNELAPNFLNYMNAALEKYKNDPSVYAVNGYNYPIVNDDITSGDVYRFKGYCAWGVGIWRGKRLKINRSHSYVIHYVRNPLNLLRTNRIASSYNTFFVRHALMGRYVGDAMICLNLIQNKWDCLFPVRTLVRNLGTDGSGSHHVSDKRFMDQILFNGLTEPESLINEAELRIVKRRLKKYFSIGTIATLRWIRDYIIFIVKHLTNRQVLY